MTYKVDIPSARTLKRPRWFIIILLSLLIIILSKPSVSLQVFMWSFGIVCMALGAIRYWAVCLKRPEEPEHISYYPRVTILLPLYDEAHMVPQLFEAVSALDYPRDKLQIIAICEPDDPATIEAVQENLKPPFEIFVTHGELPRTKPHALNQALSAARGEIVTIFDAEDRPTPNQVRRAVAAFEAYPKWGAVQAPLSFQNARDNWLTRQFALEYDAQFQVWLPALRFLGLPFPLGGTSNYVRREALKKCGGWDAYNVTEDADLSFRLAAMGWGIGFISPPTYETAPTSWRVWRKQRTRWLKGFIQTWLVHMRRPLAPGGRRGLFRQFTLQLTVGMTLAAAILHLPFLLSLIAVILTTESLAQLGLYYLGLCLGFSYLAGLLIGLAGAVRLRRWGQLPYIIMMPAYWVLMFVPAVSAIYEFWVTPFYWHKTPHNVSAPAYV